MNITINKALQAYIDPLTSSEYAALERSILIEGCRDALVLWGEVLIDGHNRYAICQKHGIAFKTVQNPNFKAIEDVLLWMIDNHLARRSVSDFQRGVLALRKKEIIAERAKAQQGIAPTAGDAETAKPTPGNSREDIAKEARLSSNTVSQIEKIQRTASPELVEAVRAGTISINAAAAVASLPSAEQAAAVAGGKKELMQAAKQVRELKAGAKPAAVSANLSNPASNSNIDVGEEIQDLRAQISALTQENTALHQQVAELTRALAQTTPAA
ncbi:MAG: hypothetical protein V4805_09175 [Pseudomonadota bacterium]